MKKIVLLAGLIAACSPADDRLSRQSFPLEISVPGDYPTIQQALAAASQGDTVVVAPGEYNESPYVPRGVKLLGSGMDLSIIRGQVMLLDGPGAEIEGFAVIHPGGILDPNIGIEGGVENFRIHRCRVEGFLTGIWSERLNNGYVTSNLVVRNQYGMRFYNTQEPVFVMNNLILNNRKSGVLTSAEHFISPTVAFNTIVGNGFGETIENGGGGITTLPPNGMDAFMFNVVVSNHAGINQWQGNSNTWGNLVWGNVENYTDGPHEDYMHVDEDPRFVDPANKDFRLRFDSPAIDMGELRYTNEDFDGNPRPQGAATDLGAFEFVPVAPDSDLIISEVMTNALDETTGEFIELYNPAASGIEAAGLALDDGDAIDMLTAYQGGPTVVPPGGYAVVIDRDYPGTYNIPAGTVLLTVDSAALGSGLAISDPINISRDGVMISSYYHPFNPGNGVSTERIDLAGPDEFPNWVPSPCGASPGEPNCISAGPAGPELVITEVMANPEVQTQGEFVEVYNYGATPIELTGLILADGDSTDALIAAGGKASLLDPGGYGVILDPDLVPQMDGPPYYLDGTVPVVVTVANTALGNGLASSDPVTLYLDDGQTVVSTFSHPMPTSVQSIERVDPLEADLADNWIPSPCSAGHSAGRVNCASGGGDPGPAAGLVIGEVMANAIDEDQGEFIEIVNRGAQPVDAAGLVFSDGDATDVVKAFPGQTDTVIPPGGYALILDPEYTGFYDIPAGVILLSPSNTTLGNSLATNDPITLMAHDGIAVVSTFLSPFNPGNGISAERIDLAAADTPDNWQASPCPAKSSPGAPNCAQ
jgi:hypothetical protein